MSEIKAGDWVTISGAGPYEVATWEIPVEPWFYIRVPVAGDVTMRGVLPEWCTKVEPPPQPKWKPDPGTLWLDSAYRPAVWQVTEDGKHMQRMGTSVIRMCEYVQSHYCPLTQLVAKEQA